MKRTSAATIDRASIDREWKPLRKTRWQEFESYHDRFARRLYCLFYWRVLDRQRARSLTVELFEYAWCNQWKFRLRNITFGAWLYRLALEFSRRKSLRVPAFGSRPAELSARQNRILDRVGQLPVASQDLFLLYFWAELQPREIGVIVSQSPERVHRRIRRLRREFSSDPEARQARG